MWSLHSELFTLQYETTQGEKGPVVRPIILTAGFIERKVRNMGGGGGGRNATGFLSSHPGSPICPHTNGSRVSLSFIV